MEEGYIPNGNFLVSFSSIVLELNELLGMRFITDFSSYETAGIRSYLGKSLLQVIHYNNRGESDLRDAELAKLRLLVKQLRSIKAYDTILFNSFKKRLHSSLSWEQYFGVRMEINVSASLINKNIKFTKTEHPDFIIHTERNVYIECASIHISKRTPSETRYKIDSVIRKKSSKHYCKSDLALFVDITNIVFWSTVNKNFFTTAELKEQTKNALVKVKSKLGSIVLFTYVMNSVLKRFESNYIRVDNDSVDALLLNFLDTYYPFGEHWVDITLQPSLG